MLEIKQVSSEKEIELTRKLFFEYADYLGIDLNFQDFDSEVENLPGDYSPPDGCILLAFYESALAGCVALRRFEDCICEMKRLYVREGYRGLGIGRQLSRRLIEQAKNFGYKKMLLDTLPTMTEAMGLYKSLGFKEIAPYRHNPIVGTRFFELEMDN